MKQFGLFTALWAIALFLGSCVTDPVDAPLGEYEVGVLIMNEGAFGSNDGEVYHYIPASGELKPAIFEAENSRPYAGLLQDIVVTEDRTYLVANTGKVEVVDSKDFSSLGAVSEGLDITRSLVFVNQKLYISDWGAYDADFNSPESYIAVVNDATGGAIAKKIPVASRPEGLFVQDNNLLVACASAKKLEVISLSSETVAGSKDIEGSPVRFFEHGGKLYLYARDADHIYFHELNRTNHNVVGTVKVGLEGSTSNFALGDNGDVYVLTSTGWPDYNDAVAKISVSGQVSDASIYTGSGFYGIGFHPNQKNIYIGDNNGFQGNGTVIIINQTGQEVTTLEVGRGPSGFVFK